jgi:dynein intermediate chain
MSHAKTDEVSITCFSFPRDETAAFYIGTEEGGIYSCNRYDRSGGKAGIDHTQVFSSPDGGNAHEAMVSGLHIHPSHPHLMLTSSLDWTVRLWNTKTRSMERLFDDAQDYVMDVKWSPTHASMFSTLDASGGVCVYNLNYDGEVPCAYVEGRGGGGGNKIAWDRGGRNIGVAGSDGVDVYSIGDYSADAGTLFSLS